MFKLNRESINQPSNFIREYDIVVCGGGVAGLWLLNVLVKAGFNVILIEKHALGGNQTIASQGMIHGGQRYMLGANPSNHADIVEPLPDRWNACLEGRGELDLSEVRVLSETQVMWPTGGRLAHLALSTATHMLKAKTRKFATHEVPKALAGLTTSSIYELPEKVLDVGSLVEVLSGPHNARILRATVDSLASDGSLTVSGLQIKSQIVICAAGLGNEEFLAMLNVGAVTSQRRPLRQFMVKSMDFPLYGHGITTSYKPRITVTSYPLQSGGYVWYLGGAIADEALTLSEDDAIFFVKNEMQSLFSNLDWSAKQWAIWDCIRAEAYCQTGRLPSGPVVQEYGNALVVWPTKLTLTPMLGDYVIERLEKRGVYPFKSDSVRLISQFASPPMASFPWEQVDWQ